MELMLTLALFLWSLDSSTKTIFIRQSITEYDNSAQ
jgi:hypothetical protein